MKFMSIYRLILKMVNDGYGDFCFEIGDNEIYFIKNIISSCNKELKRLIDKSSNSRIKIKDPLITEKSLINLLIYYGNGTLELSDNNVVDMFYTCLILKENVLRLYIENYISHHCNINIMNKLLDIVCSVDSIEISNINRMVFDYLQLNGYKLLSENEINDLSINSISYILHIPNLIIKSENYLLKKLIAHYNNSKRQLERFVSITYSSSSPSKRNKNKLNENYKNLFDLLNWEKISLREFSKSETEIIKNILKEVEESKTKRNNENIKVKRVYIDPIRSGNEKFDNYLLEYIKVYKLEEGVVSVSEEDKYDLLSIKNLNEIISSIVMDNNSSRLICQIICLIIISDLELNIKLNVTTRSYLLSSLIYEFQQMNNKNKRVNINIIKAIAISITDNNDLMNLYKSCGINIFSMILNFSDNSSSHQHKVEMIIKFIQQNLKSNQSEYDSLIKSLINTEIKEKFYIHNQIEFKYPNKKYTFYEGDSFEIIPQFINEKPFDFSSNNNNNNNNHLFTVTPKFPSFITFNTSNGRIKSEKTKRLPETKFVVKYESKTSQYSRSNIETDIIISIESVGFENYDNVLKVDESGKILSYDNNGLISFRGMNERLRSEVNLKIKNGTYHIKYLIKDIKNVIFGVCDKRNENIETSIEYTQFENKKKSFLVSPSKLRNLSEKVLLEVIISMDNRLLSYKHRDKIESLKFNAKSSQLIPFICLNEMDLSHTSSIEILSVYKED